MGGVLTTLMRADSRSSDEAEQGAGSFTMRMGAGSASAIICRGLLAQSFYNMILAVNIVLVSNELLFGQPDQSQYSIHLISHPKFKATTAKTLRFSRSIARVSFPVNEAT